MLISNQGSKLKPRVVSRQAASLEILKSVESHKVLNQPKRTRSMNILSKHQIQIIKTRLENVKITKKQYKIYKKCKKLINKILFTFILFHK